MGKVCVAEKLKTLHLTSLPSVLVPFLQLMLCLHDDHNNDLLNNETALIYLCCLVTCSYT